MNRSWKLRLSGLASVLALGATLVAADAGANGAPRLGKIPEGYSDVTMMSTLWEHGPRMLEVMNERNLPWPSFTAPDMTDLIAYLNSL